MKHPWPESAKKAPVNTRKNDMIEDTFIGWKGQMSAWLAERCSSGYLLTTTQVTKLNLYQNHRDIIPKSLQAVIDDEGRMTNYCLKFKKL